MLVERKTFDEERALYGQNNIAVKRCVFQGPKDGESPLKECKNVFVRDSLFDLRYPFWHNTNTFIENTTFTQNCRAPFWYTKSLHIEKSSLDGIKAVRESKKVEIENCIINSPEFGWFVKDFNFHDGSANSEYFLLHSSGIKLNNVKLEGKYSFQYVKNGTILNSTLNTKDAFWHAKNITIKNCIVNGEYLGWYSENLTFINCRISGSQPFCYCRNLKLINCSMEGCELAFEKSTVRGNISTLTSVKNFYKGKVTVLSPVEIIRDDPKAKGRIILNELN